MADILSQLRAFSWTSGNGVSIEFPVTQMSMEFEQDLAEHRFWGLDGAQVEATGRGPLIITAQIPFKNHIVPGKNESFTTLYPEVFRSFIRATTDRSTGTLIHPEFGPIQCKVQRVHVDWKSGSRDGVDVDVSWVETLTEDSVSQINNSTSPVQEVETFAGDLDASLSSTFLPSDPVYEPNFLDTMQSIAGVADQIGLQSQRIAGKIDNVSYRLNRIEDSVTRAATPPRTSVKSIINPDTSATNKALTTLYWPVRATLNSMKSGLFNLKQELLSSGKPIIFYRVPRPCTVASLVIATGAKVSDIMNLNPAIMAKPVVPTGSVIRYYQP